MNKLWQDEAWADYPYWQQQDKKLLKRINQLPKDINRSGYDGIGKSEPLKGDLSGWQSRRIDDIHRLVYRIRGGRIEIVQCRTHHGEQQRAGATTPVPQNAKNRTFVLCQGANAMKITVMQVNNELTSTGVSAYVDGQPLGGIGPGGGVPTSLEAPSYLVRAECGVYSRELILGQDSAPQVSRGPNPPEMIVSHAKK